MKSISAVKTFLKRTRKKKGYLLNYFKDLPNKVITPKRSLPILIVILLMICGGVFAFSNYKNSTLLVDAKNLFSEEKYEDAIEKLSLAQASWVVNLLSINKEEIEEDIIKNKKSIDEKDIYEKAIEEFNNTNWVNAMTFLSLIPQESVYFSKAELKIEETRTKMTEEELEEAKEAIVIAEQRAEQEEVIRKEKEKELAEKEEEERELEEDKDNDGLTNREELVLGTSDYDNDTDDDGIYDGEDVHPAGGGRYQAQTFSWAYEGYDWTWNENIHEDWYEYYKNKKRVEHGTDYVTYDDPFIERIAELISDKNAEKGFLCKSCLAISFIQSLSYIYDFYTGYDEYPKYPVETFFEKNGDCEDTSYLAASIIYALGVDVRLVILPSHMAIAVSFNCDTAGTYYKADGKCYYYVETTSEDFEVGEIPNQFSSTRAELINIGTGGRDEFYPSYNSPCYESYIYSGYYTDGEYYYKDSACHNITICLPDVLDSEKYWNGYYSYWDNDCTLRVVSGCDKSVLYPGFFYNGYDWYVDYRCTQKAYLE
jgi:hypothetical protein